MNNLTYATSGRVRVFVAVSLDGFVAGESDDLSWLPTGDGEPESNSDALGFNEFIENVGVILMGRRTYDVVTAFNVPWPYGDREVWIATHRPLDPIAPLVKPVTGSMPELVRSALETAAPRDVYVDGPALIRQVLDADLIDEVILTVVPTALGKGVSLFAGTSRRHEFSILSHHRYGNGIIQLRAQPKRPQTP